MNDYEWKNTGDFQHSGRDGFDHEQRNSGNFQPSGRDDHNDAAGCGNQQQHNQNTFQNNGRFRNNETRGGQHQRESYQGGDSSRPADHGFQMDERPTERKQHSQRRGDDRHFKQMLVKLCFQSKSI